MPANQTIICLHGLGRTAEDWSLVRDRLNRIGNVITPTLPRSHQPALECALASIPESGAILIGHSFGAILALQAAEQLKNRVRALILTDSFFPPARNGRSTIATFKDYLWHRYMFLKQARTTRLPVGVPAKGTTGLSVLLRIAFNRHDFETMCSSIAVPVLIIHSINDYYVPVAFAQAAAKRHPTWTYQELSTGGHYPHILNTDNWLQTVTEWIGDQNLV